MITPREFKLVGILGKTQWDETVYTEDDLPKPKEIEEQSGIPKSIIY
jgi:hypothetical protein